MAEFVGCPQCGSELVVARHGPDRLSERDAMDFILTEQKHMAYSIECEECGYTNAHSLSKR
jgi:ribosomal protein S27AE